MTKQRVKPESIVIIGTGRLAANCVEACLEHSLSVLCLESEQLMFSPLASLCRKRGVEYRPAFERQMLTDFFLRIDKPTLVVSAFNYYIFPASVLENPVLNVVNFHNSLLPRHRGRNAATWSIFNQDAVAGITWHQVQARVDTGEVIIEKEIPIGTDTTAMDLTLKSLDLAAQAFREILPALLTGSYSVQPVSRTDGASYHRSTEVPNDGWLDLGWSFARIYAFLRALDYGKFRILPPPRLRLLGRELTITNYRWQRQPAPANATNTIELNGNILQLRSGGAELSMTCEESKQDSKHE
ncbi:MAG TPA: formyltransferase family protein [Verrucomicrobiae bacterium]|nr:formyltransferase family protein [Verrucomicrobiae bacterium]